jgi:hypothetical protein
MADKQNVELSKIIKRLELIKSLISLEEEDEIDAQIIKLEQSPLSDELQNIIVCLKEKNYSKAAVAIEEFINNHNSISVYLNARNSFISIWDKYFVNTKEKLSEQIQELENGKL